MTILSAMHDLTLAGQFADRLASSRAVVSLSTEMPHMS